MFGAVLTAAEKKAMDMEINCQIVEADRRYADDIDAMVLYTLHVHLGFGKKRLRKFYDAFSAEHVSYCAAYCIKPMPLLKLQSADAYKFICIETEECAECYCGGDTDRCTFYQKEDK